MIDTATLAEQTVSALAFAGDLSMGQPPEHSPVVAILASRVAELSGASEVQRNEAALLALIRWAGCTGNARDFADLLGDDIRGRAELLAGRNPFVAAEPPSGPLYAALKPLAESHCEIAGLLARRLQLPPALNDAVADIFEAWDGSGLPAGKSGEAICEAAQYVSLAGDAEVFTRVFGVTRAAYLIETRAGTKYEAGLARAVARALPGWADGIGSGSLIASALDAAGTARLPEIDRREAIRLLGDFIDLKVPGHAGRSRAIAELAHLAANSAGLPAEAAERVAEAVAVASIGQVAIPNRAFGRRDLAEEHVRLAPHRTTRILSRMPALGMTAALAAAACERSDTGSARGTWTTAGRETRIVQALIAAAEAHGAFLAGRWSLGSAEDCLRREVRAGALDGDAVECVLAAMGSRRATPRTSNEGDLTPREVDVLKELAAGRANKEIARNLDISPKTVSTHLERVFSKLDVRSRAAATLKAIENGLV